MTSALSNGGVPDMRAKIAQANSLSKTSNFWQLGEFQRVVSRVDDGAQLLEDFSRLVLERAHIEKKYAQLLSSWSKKWQAKIQKNQEEEDGTLRPAWNSLLTEADQLAEVHSKLDERLRDEVHSTITNWKKGIYKRHITRAWKITKESHEGFVRAQKPWAKLMKQAKKAKKTYYSSCDAKSAAKTKLDTAHVDSNVAAEEISKLEAKLRKCEASVKETKQSYERSISALVQDKTRYQTSMEEVYTSCQDIEQQRQDFFKSTMLKYTSILSEHTPKQCETMQQTVDQVNPDADLVNYTLNKGIGMRLCVPEFQDYGAKPKIELVANTVVGTREIPSVPIEHESDDDDSDDDDEWDGEDDWTPPLEMDMSACRGRRVRAIYDYISEEPEEVSLKVGDIITVLEEEDEQGWCKGILDKTKLGGLFPACYVEPVEDADDFCGSADQDSQAVDSHTQNQSTDSAAYEGVGMGDSYQHPPSTQLDQDSYHQRGYPHSAEYAMYEGDDAGQRQSQPGYAQQLGMYNDDDAVSEAVDEASGYVVADGSIVAQGHDAAC
eukprot:m.116290 g.116290  ORF g.116290 m.116290 type:complete len:550 (-) comp13602_c0_seq5:414-2063(-)